MALPGELGNMLDDLSDTCSECGAHLPLKVLKTNAYYLGTFCENDGPYARKTGYFASAEKAEAALAEIEAGRGIPELRDARYHG